MTFAQGILAANAPFVLKYISIVAGLAAARSGHHLPAAKSAGHGRRFIEIEYRDSCWPQRIFGGKNIPY